MSNLTPMKAIRAKCLECSNGQPKEVRGCIITECPLYAFRLGKNPNRSGIGNSKACFSQNTGSEEAISQ